MTTCPVCMGDGEHDFRESDKMIAKTWTDAEITNAIAQGMIWPIGVVECDVCEGTGQVDDDHAKDIAAAARAAVDQVQARLRDSPL